MYLFQADRMMTRMKEFITPLCEESQILMRPQELEDKFPFSNNIPISEYQQVILNVCMGVKNPFNIFHPLNLVTESLGVLIWAIFHFV